MFTPIFVTWIIFLGFIIMRGIIFLVSFYIVAKRNWAEKQLKWKIEEILAAFESDKPNKT